MSIIMAGATSAATAAQQASPADEIEPGVQALLDHIAVELAEEYVRLMEAAAHADTEDAR
jgi:opacity protein-like surface antigen